MASIKLTGDTSGEITISAPAVAGTNTLTLPATTGTMALTSDVSEPNLVKLAGETLSSNASTVEFSTSIITTTYKSYILYARMRPVTDIARLLLRFNDNTGTVLASVTDYQMQAYRGGGVDFNDDTMSAITHIGGTGTGTGEYVVQRYEIHEPRATDRKTIITFHCGYADTVGDSALTIGSGTCDTAEDNQGFRIFFDNGDIASGSSYVLFGVKS